KVEEAAVDELFSRPQHPYTRGLLASIPRLRAARDDAPDKHLQEIPGIVPALTNLPPGCTFAPRCPFAEDRCRREFPSFEEKRPGHWAACWRAGAIDGAGRG